MAPSVFCFDYVVENKFCSYQNTLYFHAMTEKKTDLRGGKRPGAGQPKKPETALLNFRVPLTLKTTAKKQHGKKLNTKFLVWLNSITGQS